MRGSATCEYGSFEWYLARCREGTCCRAIASQKIRPKLLSQCILDARGKNRTDEDRLTEVTNRLLDTCPRQGN